MRLRSVVNSNCEKYTNMFRLAYSQWNILKSAPGNFATPAYFPLSFRMKPLKNLSNVFHEI